MRATISWLRKQISDEKKSSIMYRRRGFPEIARQETLHKIKLLKRLRRMRRRT